MKALTEKLRTAVWFARQPSFWPHMVALTRRKFDGSTKHELAYPEARAWAAERAVPVAEALAVVGALAPYAPLPDGLDPALIAAGEARAAKAQVAMGGPGDLDLIHRAILSIGARRVVETGVAYGWSSLAALAALRQYEGRLVSVDMPYPKADNEAYVGIAVPPEWRESWTLIRKPDRNGIAEAIAHFGGAIDLAHFDSDKSYPGRMYAYPLLWRALRPGGLFISDDIQDNYGFRDFARSLELPFAVTESDGKFVGIIAKPR